MSGMKAKTIKAVLRKKIDSWVASIEDPVLAAAARRDAIVTGGCIASMLLGEKVNDYDVYFRTKETVVALAKYYAARFAKLHGESEEFAKVQEIEDVRGEPRVRIFIQSRGSAGAAEDAGTYDSEVLDDPALAESLTETEEAAVERAPYDPVFLSSNAVMLAGKVQLILRFFGTPEEIHKNYDFTHCTNHWESADGNLVLRAEALQCLMSRTLVYQGSRYPVCSLMRVRKFVNRGWRINAGQMLKIILQANELDLGDVSVLEDQLTGVDVAYFSMVLEAMKERDQKRVDASYLVEVLDRMFGE